MSKTVTTLAFRRTLTALTDVVLTIERTKEFDERGRLVSMADRTVTRNYLPR